jgi:DNA ligase-1
MNNATLPTLFKRTSTGAIQTWRIDVENGSTLVATYGQLNGKLQTTRDEITSGKNAGRANATTPDEQAQLEAKAQHEKKQKRGYVTSIDDAAKGRIDDTVIAGGISPMLAHAFKDHGHKITYPAYTQPKLDGHRCIAIIKDGVATLWTRTRKPITSVPHIVKALEASGMDDAILDGELYNHDYRDHFEDLTSFIKRPVPKPGHEVVQYHVYDIVTNDPFSVRQQDRWWAAHDLGTGPIVIVDTQLVNDEDEAMEAFDAYLAAGYEGSMLRNADSLYENKRSYGLQKVKEWQDAEYVITDVTEGRGKMAGKAVFVCETPSGQPFRVKMKGTLDSLRQYVDDPSLALGKQLTVQYQNLTSDGIPRFPIGLRLRKDI